jgi:hypothetical protein
MSLILVFNKNSPWAHTESELGVHVVHGKLVKYVVHLSKKKKLKKKKNSSHKLPKRQLTSFWSQGILGVNHTKSIWYQKSFSFFFLQQRERKTPSLRGRKSPAQLWAGRSCLAPLVFFLFLLAVKVALYLFQKKKKKKPSSEPRDKTQRKQAGEGKHKKSRCYQKS